MLPARLRSIGGRPWTVRLAAGERRWPDALGSSTQSRMAGNGPLLAHVEPSRRQGPPRLGGTDEPLVARPSVRKPAGATMSPIPYGGGLVELEFDLLAHTLGLRVSNGRGRSMPLASMSVAEFYGQVLELLEAAHIAVPLRPVPVEVANAIPFADDTAPGRYEPDHARALHSALVNGHRVLTQFRGSFSGRPVQFTSSGAASTWPRHASPGGGRRAILAACRIARTTSCTRRTPTR